MRLDVVTIRPRGSIQEVTAELCSSLVGRLSGGYGGRGESVNEEGRSNQYLGK